MEPSNTIERVRSLFKKTDAADQEYEPIEDDYDERTSDQDVRRPVLVIPEIDEGQPFSWMEYVVFLFMGVAMLWAWNMFLAAAPYFQSRFADNESILNSFQPAITSVGCITNLSSMLLLAQLQKTANYPKRILSSLLINIIVFVLLSISTSWFRGVSSPAYLVFTLIMVFSTSCATGLCQNGAFAFASSFGRPEYINAIMTGQAVAGVLPSVAQILSVLAVPTPDSWSDSSQEVATLKTENTTAAFIYFLTATAISVITLIAVIPLIRKHNRILAAVDDNESVLSIGENSKRHVVSMWTLYKKLHWLAASVFICFAITMFFPVFTQKVVSIIPEDTAPALLRPSAFIPLGFLVWNLGDLIGRLITLMPISMRHHPLVLFVFSLARTVFIPMYFLCNLENKGAVIKSDAFYLFIVQFGFGATNGWLSSSCMMGTGEYVDDGEREAAGGFMAVNLVAGLTAGSLLSFTASGAS